MNTKLILIEGLPGSGKSTTAGMAAEILKQKGIETNLFLEGNLDHPADYDGVAFFQKESGNAC
jgi:thymidylate kinase